MGRDGIDNGFISFNHIRIPRENMLMKWAKVSPEGIFSERPKAQLSYGALIVGRVVKIKDVQKLLTIVIHYRTIRK